MDTNGHCFPESIIIQAVYLKLRFALSYRDVEEIMRNFRIEVADPNGYENHWDIFI